MTSFTVPAEVRERLQSLRPEITFRWDVAWLWTEGFKVSVTAEFTEDDLGEPEEPTGTYAGTMQVVLADDGSVWDYWVGDWEHQTRSLTEEEEDALERGISHLIGFAEDGTLEALEALGWVTLSRSLAEAAQSASDALQRVVDYHTSNVRHSTSD